ncbi:MAG: PTS sugar transporter subunit IIA [Erysipelotrichaceae bacterium]|nr:PTS sugar transporter subunit IIA [Erysipelotrichaceae bacterium]MDP3305822.1 PTS sugar transporter subunit IIA [Erysipelotrichaceae bacterium]
MLRDLLNKDTIELSVVAENWKEAITRGGELLIRKGFIKKSYIDEMIDSVNQLGPYIVVMPGVAFAHAKPSESVLCNGLSLVRFETPVEFGNVKNDPVSVMFTIAAVDDKKHMDELQSLAMLLMQDENIEKLMNSSKEEIIQLIEGY